MKDNDRKKDNLYKGFMVVKYLFSTAILILLLLVKMESFLFGIGLLELFVIIILSNELLKRNKAFLAVHCLLMLLFNLQLGVMYFAGDKINMLFISNLDMAFDLAGRAFLYISALIVVIVVSCLPITVISDAKSLPGYGGLSALLAIEILLTAVFGCGYSPLLGYVSLAQEAVAYQSMTAEFIADDGTYALFYKEDLWDARTPFTDLPENPNIILIFTEGLSRHVLYDSRDIMPNVKKYETESIHFEHYYNHTFATYRGLNGQLYSAYQRDNYDRNYLISVQDMIADAGYHTCLINTEPHNHSFTQYLENLGFQEFISDPRQNYQGKVNTMSDTEAYEALFDTALRLHGNDQPFFTAIYTMGTHITFDGEEKFGDGKDEELNKFWNCDVQFGKFMDKFNESPLSEDTIIIFTTDHATYADEPYTRAFSSYKREHNRLDEIPLFIYYKGVESESINVRGRNTLDLAPTICDILDISAPNYFLGISLFYPYNEENGIFYDTVYFDTHTAVSTKAGKVESLDETDTKFFQENVKNYFAIARNERK